MTSPDRSEPPEILRALAELLSTAGDATMEIFRRDNFEVGHKSDDSPVTEADLASQRILVAGLEDRLCRFFEQQVPIIAEESASAPWSERRSWNHVWLVDPLDGTREFVGGRGEFTVNVALVEDGRPVLGAVRAPVLGKTWLGCVEFMGRTGAWRIDDDGSTRPISVAPAENPVRIVASRSHRGPDVDAFLEHFGDHALVSMGSSLKLCILAEGGADLYPRLGRTMEWDIAAADAVLRGAGGTVLAPGRGAGAAPLRYNKEDLANPYFLAVTSPEIGWQTAWRAAITSSTPPGVPTTR